MFLENKINPNKSIARRKYSGSSTTGSYETSNISYQHLMQERIINILLICSNYDAFILEEDGRIHEKIYLEYASEGFHSPPKITQANSPEKSFELLDKKKFDLIIITPNIGRIDAFEMAKRLKEKCTAIPIVILTQFSREISIRLTHENLSYIDYVFYWGGNSSLLLAIIKLLEDKINADHDINEKGVQAILLVEDSIKYYSAYLPIIYKAIFDQTIDLMTEGLNEYQKVLRMRARPKILFARTFEEAVQLYRTYTHNLLGVISDISYFVHGQMDREAGIKLARLIRGDGSKIPILLQSSGSWDTHRIKDLGLNFINKYSKRLLIELKDYIKGNYGFGDFVFRDPDKDIEITKANNLNSLQTKIAEIDAKSLIYHVSNNHFSRWLKARALFSLANLFAQKSKEDFNNTEEIRNYLINTIINYRKAMGRGIIASHLDEYAIFSRMGDGQLGGKARGIAFVDYFLNKYDLMCAWDNVIVTIPRTIVLATNLYDEFIENNKLNNLLFADASDEEIIERFSNANTPLRIQQYVAKICEALKSPLAVRSSSLLEDSYYQPFAGVYSTFMIPNNHQDIKVRRYQLEQAIKSVYASIFFKQSRAYISATSNVIDQEKMGIVIQELSGSKYGGCFFPTISGVARSVNFYPIEPEKYEDGIANIAFGLGKIIVDGGRSISFCPKYPKKIFQLSTVELALSGNQNEFYALDLAPEKFHPSIDEAVNLLKLNIDSVENYNAFKLVASTFDYHDNTIRDGIHEGGKKIITFSSVLKYNSFPLVDILQRLLTIGQMEMNCQVEIEFAVNLNTQNGEQQTFHVLQIRPVVETEEVSHINLDKCAEKKTILSSNHVLGNGIINNVSDIVYVKPEVFNPADTKIIAKTIDKLNSQFIERKKNYILIGPGRWGSNDPWLGIPVRWIQISAARLIVESGLENYRIDPSQGTHFLQNLTSFKVGYFTINPFIKDGFYDVEFLNNQKVFFEDQYIRHVSFQSPTIIKIDGRKNTGVVFKPGPV